VQPSRDSSFICLRSCVGRSRGIKARRWPSTRFSVDTNIDVYFCDPHSPWQRGSNENTNALLRQYFPKTADLSAYTRADLAAVARQLNTRPRQTLAWKKPAEVFCLTVASTG
jgi:IS30 family transposase